MAAHDPRKPQPTNSDQPFLPEVDLGDEGVIDLGELDLSSEGSSIPLAELPELPSGQSLTSWTEVIRRQRAAQEEVKVAKAVEVDAESDKDLLNHFTHTADVVESPSDAKRSGDTSEIPQNEIPVFTSAPPSESDMDLNSSPISLGTTGSEIGFDIFFPPSDAGGAMPIPKPTVSDVNFRSQAAQATEDEEEIPFGLTPSAGMSGVDLGASVGAAEPGRSSILDVLLRGSAARADSDPEQAHDFDKPPLAPLRSPQISRSLPSQSMPEATQPAIALSDGFELYESDAEVNFSGLSSNSGSEDVVDVYALGGIAASLTDSGTLEISEEAIEESQRNADIKNSSSVDLNSRSNFSGADFVLELQEPAGLRPGHSSDSDIDLDLPPSQDEGDSSLILSRDLLDANQAAIAAEFKARKQHFIAKDSSRNEVVPSRRDEPERQRRGYLLHGGILGLLFGAGSVLAAYFGGALPNRNQAIAPAVADNSGQIAQFREESIAAKKQAAENKTNLETLRKALADAGVDADKPAATVAALKQENERIDVQVKQLMGDATRAKVTLLAAQKTEKEAKEAADLATKGLADAEKAATDAKKLLADAMKAEEAAKTETIAAKKAQDIAKAETVATKKAAVDAMAAVSKSLATAGLDPAKLDESLKKLADARTVAETKEKETALKLNEATKKEADLVKIVEATKKQADDAAKLREASELTVKGIVDRLAKAKFVGEKPDVPAVLKGLDEAIKSASTDTSMAMREELVKARAAEAKMKTDLAVAKEHETEATKVTVAAQAEAKKFQEALKIVETKTLLDAAKYKTDLEKLTKEANDARANADLALKDAVSAKANVDRLAAESARVKTENDRLAKDLEAVRELADLIKAQPGSIGTNTKLDPAKLGERYFNDGLRAYFAGRHVEAETAFRKAIQFKLDDARYHYLHGLSLWMIENMKEAELAFEKGRDLEREARPPSRIVSGVLERVQGPARQAVNAYRP